MKQGLSLIELVISVAIVSLLALAGAIAVGQIKNTRALEASAAELAVVIERARSLSQAPLKDASFADFKSYGVAIDKTNSRYALEARRNEKGTGEKKTIQSFKLDKGVQFGATILGGKSGIYFAVEKNGEITNLAGVNQPTIFLEKAAQSKKIKISNPYGVVEIE